MSLEKNPIFVLNLSESDLRGETKHFYEFKSFRLNVEERQLLHDNSPVSLTPKSFDVLALLVENRGHLVEKEKILEVIWANSFVEEQNITRTIHTLRKTLGDDSNGNRFIETVAKKGYRFVAEVVETGEDDKQQSAVALSGKRDDAIEEQPTVNSPLSTTDKPKPNTRVILFTFGFLTAVFLILLMSFNFRSDSAANPNKVKSVAVLPLKPINSANRDEVYEIGIADSLIYRLGTMKGIIVRPLGATRQYADVDKNPLVAGKEQQADYVLASNYQIADGKIRITAQLFDVATGKVEETYKTEKDAGNIFALQDAIAGEVGNLLLNHFALIPNDTMAKRGTNNEEAYRLYLQGKNLTMKPLKGNSNKAIECFEQAIKLDPNYALAYARMAFAYYFGGLNENNSANAEKVKGIVNKALELDPNLAEAYVTRGFVSSLYDWDFRAGEKDYLRAIELEPNNDTAHWLYAMRLTSYGRFDEAMREIETAQAIDPGALIYMEHRGRILYYARRYDEAVTQFQQVRDLDDRLVQPYAGLSRVYEIKGDYAAAYQFFLKKEERSPRKDRLGIYQKAYETAGWMGVRQELAESLEFNFFDLARLYALQGEKDAAFETLNKSVEKREWFIAMLNVEPAFDNLRGDARFEELVGRVGLK